MLDELRHGGGGVDPAIVRERERDFLVRAGTSDDPRERQRGIDYSREYAAGGDLMAEALTRRGARPDTVRAVRGAPAQDPVWEEVGDQISQADAFAGWGRRAAPVRLDGGTANEWPRRALGWGGRD
ncbi:MAG: hypothetical protein OXC71_08975 [Chloroflexi bacterium]|nr:hypothetical protein [Chloroflexota bacterium]